MERIPSLKPLVTVGVAAYSNPELLARALSAVARQDYRPIEVLISDDAGPVSVEPTAMRFQQENADIAVRYFRQPANLGVALNKRWLLEEAQGKYLAFCEHDDYWIDESLLSSTVDIMEEHPDVVLCAGNTAVEATEGYAPLMYANQVAAVQLTSAWAPVDPTSVAAALLAPVTVRSLTRRHDCLNLGWSSFIFRTDLARRVGAFSDAYLVPQELSVPLSTYANEESLVFVVLLLSVGQVFMTGAPVTMRGMPETAFSRSADHPARGSRNDIEVFNFLRAASMPSVAGGPLENLLVRRAVHTGLGHANPQIVEYLGGGFRGWVLTVRCRAYFELYHTVRVLMSVASRLHKRAIGKRRAV